MKKLNKKDLLNIIITIIVFLISIIFLYNKKYLYINTSQFIEDTSIIELIRNLYYKNFDLFPDFILNIGNGQNIYYLVENGFLNPITLVSYLVPFINIKTYLIIINTILSIISIILIYKFFRKKKNSEISSLLISIVYTIILVLLNTKYNLSIISYTLFLILSYYGVDKIYEKQKGYLLTISVFLMLLTNYKQSLSGIISILIYSLYRYLKQMNTITIKTITKRIISIIIPIIVSLLCSSILLIPTLLTIQDTAKITNQVSFNIITIPLILLLIPSFIIYYKKDKKNIVFIIILVSLIIINILTNYSIISYLILYLIIIENLISTIQKKKPNINILIISILIISTTILTNSLNENIYIPNKNNITKLLSTIKEDNIYRTYIETTYYNIENYTSQINTIKQNKQYQEFNKEILYNNENNDNLIGLLLNNNKYLISKNNPLHGYKKISNIGELKLYKNENTFPIGFANTNTMSYEDFSKLNKPTKQEALLNVIITDKESQNNFIPTTKKIELPLEEIFNDENIYIKENSIFINTKETLKINYQLPSKYQNKIIYIKFDIKNSRTNQIIKINNIEKHLIGNINTLEYMLSETNQTNLILTFTKGQYSLSNIEFYILDYANIENCSTKVDPFIIDNNNTKRDKIIGNIEVSQDSYFMVTIPYNSNFQILVDNKIIKYEKVDETYIGFPIKEGLHSIEIEYKTPYKFLSYLLSTLGIISFITITYFESKRNFN